MVGLDSAAGKLEGRGRVVQMHRSAMEGGRETCFLGAGNTCSGSEERAHFLEGASGA